MSEKVSCVEGARWRRQGLGTGGKEKTTVEMGIGFLGTRERKDWERKGKERDWRRECWEREAKEGKGGKVGKDGRKETGERLLRRETGERKVWKVGKEGNRGKEGGKWKQGKVGTLSWKGRAKGKERVRREKARWKGVN